jgi:hypothetical protein
MTLATLIRLGAPIALVFALFPACVNADPEMLDLYQARAVVTGTGEKNRQIGLAIALEDVLVKVSGDARLIGDPRVAELTSKAATLVDSFTYRDRMSGTPIHDEQGSYDRPHDLTVTFDKAKINAALEALGLEPWTAPRPTIALIVAVSNGNRSFMLASEGDAGADMRDSIGKAAFRVNIPAIVPARAALQHADIDVTSLDAATPEELARVGAAAGADYVVAGSLVFSDEAHGWLVGWRMDVNGETFRWTERGVNFDEAFRFALRGAAQVLSGHGSPQ